MAPVKHRDWAFFNAHKPACPKCKQRNDFVIPADWAIDPPKWYCRRCSHPWHEALLPEKKEHR